MTRESARALERFERAFDDVDARFAALGDLGLGWRATRGVSTHARCAVRATDDGR